MLQKIFLALALGVFGLLSACALLPERFSVNAPWLQKFLALAQAPTTQGLQSQIRLPAGYSISLYAENLDDPRMLLWSGDNLLVSTPSSGTVRLLRPNADNTRAESIETLFSQLDRPHGLELHQGKIYIAGQSAIYRADFDTASGTALSAPEAIASLPKRGGHWTRTIKRGPDDVLYVAVGSSCNVCIEEDERRAALLTLEPESGALEIYATGLRNTVGWDWRPSDGALYGVDNGRDLLGDDVPPDELNRIEKDAFYGWPFLYGFNTPDPDYGDTSDPRIANAIAPEHGFQAHVAPLSLLFLDANTKLPGLQDAALAALHGSWNRSSKVGYKLVSLHWDTDGNIEERDFATGFEENENVLGRPVDIALGPDGALYVSDDYAGAIYRIAAESAE